MIKILLTEHDYFFPFYANIEVKKKKNMKKINVKKNLFLTFLGF